MAPTTLETYKTRFWSRVAVGEPDACWPWLLRAADPFGYGGFWMMGRLIHSHRVAWMFTRGEIPKGICVLHRCDNPPCVNPAHLFLGTKSINSLDRHAKGRTAQGNLVNDSRRARGERAANAKLTAARVVEIRRRHAAGGITRGAIAEEYGLSPSTIGRVVSRDTWAHVEMA